MRTILVVNPKGGCGKTTIATNLASYYAVWGVATALVDLDRQRSSLDWLDARGPERPPIAGAAGWEGSATVPAGTERVILDAPAHIAPDQVDELVARADVVVLPVLPSPIDIRAAARFVGELLTRSRIRQSGRRVGVVANRVRENTLIYASLEQFLSSLGLPFVTHLRDSQNYIRAATRGLGVFELPPYLVETELEQWRPLIEWIDRGH